MFHVGDFHPCGYLLWSLGWWRDFRRLSDGARSRRPSGGSATSAGFGRGMSHRLIADWLRDGVLSTDVADRDFHADVGQNLVALGVLEGADCFLQESHRGTFGIIPVVLPQDRRDQLI